MILQKKIDQLIDILLEIKEHIKDESDCIWTYYETPEQIRDEINKYILELENGNMQSLDEINMHFLPTAAYQEHSMSNGWSDEYIKLAGEFDEIYNALKK